MADQSSYSKLIRVVATACLLLLTAGVVLWPWSGPAEARKKPRVRITLLIATGIPESTTYRVGVGLASLWTTHMRDLGVRVSAAVSEGTLENIEALRTSDADIIIAEGLPAEMAFKGTSMFKANRVPELRSVCALWDEAFHIVVRSENVSTGTINDLSGLVVATGLPGSTNRLVTEVLLKKVETNRVSLRAMSDLAAAEAIRKGVVQGMVLSGGVPVPLVSTLFGEGQPPLSLIELGPADIEALREPGWKDVGPQVIPAGTYPGQINLVKTAGQRNLLAVNAGLEDGVVYALVKTLFENLGAFAKLHPACTVLGLENAMDGVTIPLHPGAVRYFTEKKLDIPARLIPGKPDQESEDESEIER